jgi:hypothetical protein
MPGAKHLSQDSNGKSRFSSSVITIPFGSRRQEYGRILKSVASILIGTSGGEGRDFEFLQAP